MAPAIFGTDATLRNWRLRLPERLPNLKGKRLTAYTSTRSIVLPLSIIGSAIKKRNAKALRSAPA